MFFLNYFKVFLVEYMWILRCIKNQYIFSKKIRESRIHFLNWVKCLGYFQACSDLEMHGSSILINNPSIKVAIKKWGALRIPSFPGFFSKSKGLGCGEPWAYSVWASICWIGRLKGLSGGLSADSERFLLGLSNQQIGLIGINLYCFWF